MNWLSTDLKHMRVRREVYKFVSSALIWSGITLAIVAITIDLR